MSRSIQSSGTTAIATAGDAAVNVFASLTGNFEEFNLINSGSASGAFTLDGGANWGFFPAGCVVTIPAPSFVNALIQVKRIAGGTDLTGVYAYAD